jgi:hypothetical protein
LLESISESLAGIRSELGHLNALRRVQVVRNTDPQSIIEVGKSKAEIPEESSASGSSSGEEEEAEGAEGAPGKGKGKEKAVEEAA